MRNRQLRISRSTVPALLVVGGLSGCAALDEAAGDDTSMLLDDGGVFEDKAGTSARYEAESRSSTQGCTPSKEHPGYTGTGFMDFGGNGSWIEWNNIQAPLAGEYELSFRYANGTGGSRSAAILVNSSNVATMAFGPSGGWPTWRDERLKVRLRQGTNTLRVQANSSSGGPNLDYVEVRTLGVETGTCTTANERSVATMSCAGGATISAIQFASYGTPTGSCQTGFRASACHANSSMDKVRTACVGKTKCTVDANNSVFGDPCVGTFKTLAVTYTCSTGGVDNCPSDPNKTSPGECGCGVPEGTCGGGATGRVKVFILSGQSNMVGQGTIKPTAEQLAKNGGMGTLEHLVTKSALARQFAGLGKPGAWTQRSDVWIVDLTKSGPLTAGYGSNEDHIGPELQFGHVLGNFYQNPVLLIKASWGGKSLYTDFRPPSAGGTVGPSYTLLVERVRQVLSNLKQYMPSYQGQGYDIAGFAWHQGWNDRIDQTAVDAYQTNCVHLINDLRAAFGAAEMPFVIGTTGMTGWTETHPRALALMKAQLAVPADPRLRRGKVSAVDTRDYWRDAAQSPADQGYHWNRNAETYVLIGNGMGQAMTLLSPR